MTIDEEITEVKTAITKVMTGGQVVRTRNGQVELASLSQLRARLRDLELQKALGTNGNGIYGTPMIYEGR